jgi:uncharacterized membrane protein (UPF0182 family)
MLWIENILAIVAYNVPATSSPMSFLEQHPQTSHDIPNISTTIDKIKLWNEAIKFYLFYEFLVLLKAMLHLLCLQ